MKLKIIPMLCAAVLLTTTTAHAGTITETDLVDNSKDVNVKVTAEVGSTFTVSLPSSIELTQGGYSGTVGVKGDITSGNNVFVVPSAKITMHDVTARPEGTLEYEGYTHKDPVVGTVSQQETAWDYTILSSGASSGNFTYDSATQYYNTSLNVTTPKLSAGDWEGALTYNISLASHLSLAGLYDAGDNLLATWEDSGIDVSKDYTFFNHDTSTTSGCYVLTNEYPTATKVIIPSSVTRIGDYALDDCSILTSVIIPDSVTSIGRNALGYCPSLTSVTIPDSVTSIGNYAFAGCSSLTSVTISNSVTSIGSSVFEDCTGLTEIVVAENNQNYKSIDGVLFNKDATTLIKCPRNKSGDYRIADSVTSIDDKAFQTCTRLTSVTIPDGVTSIGNYAFQNCTGLTSVTIPNNVTIISQGTFESCASLTSITIPEGVTSIKANAFNYCSGLTSVTIPDSVMSIYDFAFSGCTGLASVTIPDSVTEIGNDAFRDVPHIYYNGSATGRPWGATAIN